MRMTINKIFKKKTNVKQLLMLTFSLSLIIVLSVFVNSAKISAEEIGGGSEIAVYDVGVNANTVTAEVSGTLLTIKGSGTLKDINNLPWYDFYEDGDLIDKNLITTISVEGTDANNKLKFNSDSSNLFEGFKNIESITFTNIDTKNVENFSYMFSNCEKLETIDISSFDLTNATNMSFLCEKCSKLKNFIYPVTKAPKLKDVSFMFIDCKSLENISLENFDFSKVTSIKNLFAHCVYLKTFTLPNDLSNVKTINGLFAGCSSIENIDLSNCNFSKVTDMSDLFDCCSMLEHYNLPYDKLKNVKYMAGLFSANNKLKTFSFENFYVENVEDLSNCFWGCFNLKSVDFAGLNFKNLKNISNIFGDCEKLESVDFSRFNAPNLLYTSYMFMNCGLKSYDLSALNTSKVTDMSFMFADCPLEELDLETLNTSSVLNMEGMFNNASCKKINLSSFDTSNVTDMNIMFYECRNLEELDLSSFNTSNVTDMNYMFNGCESLKKLDVSNFDTENVTIANAMFKSCKALEKLSLKSFILDNCISFNEMFSGCTNLKQLDIRNIGGSNNVQLNSMFSGCSNLKELDLSGMDTSMVTSMNYLFNGCEKLEKLDLSSFDTSNVIDFTRMFNNCSSLKEINMSTFTFRDPDELSDHVTVSDMFNGCSNLEVLNIENLEFKDSTWVSQELLTGSTKLSKVYLPKKVKDDPSIYLSFNKVKEFVNGEDFTEDINDAVKYKVLPKKEEGLNFIVLLSDEYKKEYTLIKSIRDAAISNAVKTIILAQENQETLNLKDEVKAVLTDDTENQELVTYISEQIFESREAIKDIKQISDLIDKAMSLFTFNTDYDNEITDDNQDPESTPDPEEPVLNAEAVEDLMIRYELFDENTKESLSDKIDALSRCYHSVINGNDIKKEISSNESVEVFGILSKIEQEDLDKKVELIVKRIVDINKTKNIRKIIKYNTNRKENILTYYDINIINKQDNSNANFVEGKKFLVKICLPKEFYSGMLNVYHIENNDAVKMETKLQMINNECIIYFETNSFSPFVITSSVTSVVALSDIEGSIDPSGLMPLSRAANNIDFTITTPSGKKADIYVDDVKKASLAQDGIYSLNEIDKPANVFVLHTNIESSHNAGGGGSRSSNSSPASIKEDNASLKGAYMTGYEDNTFKPNNYITRSEVSAILARINKDYSDSKNYKDNLSFNDVEGDIWCNNYIGFVKEKGIMVGEDNFFRPLDNMTRAEFAAAIVKMFNIEVKSNINIFKDASGSWYEDIANTLGDHNYINGYEDGTFGGENNIQRAEVCKIINSVMRAQKKDLTESDINKLKNKFTDVSVNEWYTKDIFVACFGY